MRTFAAVFPLIGLSLSAVVPSRVAKPAISRRQAAGPPVPSCTTFNISVSVERNWPTQLVSSGPDYNIQVLYALQDRKIMTTNSYNLEAVYCEATTEVSSRTNTVQLLVHGATLTKQMWDFPYQPEKYSWVRHNTAQGFSTLHFDIVGAGNSSKPDGLLEAHCQVYVETIHQIVQKLRAGDIGGKKFDKVITIGFSVGAVALVSFAKQYPTDADALVLHGFSWNSATLYQGFFAGLQLPAAQVDPQKWGSLPLSYTTQSTPASRAASVFYGNFDPGIVSVDYALRDTDTLGASISIPAHTVYVEEYTGPVFLGNGNEDITFCGQHCGVDPYEVYHYFPNAASWTVKIYPETAHLILFHNTAPDLMNDTLKFLEAAGL